MVNRLLTDRQCMASLVCWLVVTLAWLIFGARGLPFIIDRIAANAF